LRQEGIKISERRMALVTSYRNLQAWQKAFRLVTEVCTISPVFTSSKICILTSQDPRCAVTIPGNIAKGHGRYSAADYKRFSHIAVGSLFVLQAQMAFNVKYITKNISEAFLKRTREIDKMLLSLISKLN
jgi:four helix bundle protein